MQKESQGPWTAHRRHALARVLFLVLGCMVAVCTLYTHPAGATAALTHKQGDHLVYSGIVSSAGTFVSALRASDGHARWQYKMSNEATTIELTSLTVADGKVYAVTGPDFSTSTVSVLRASDGRLLWQRTYHHAKGSFIFATGNNVVYVGTARSPSDTVDALRASDGKLLWQYKTDHFWDLTVTSKAIYVVTVTNNLSATTVHALSVGDGRQRWQYTESGEFAELATTQRAVLFATTGKSEGSLAALRESDGHLLWHDTIQGGILRMVLKGAIYIATFDGSLCALRTSDGRQRWCYHSSGGFSSIFTVTNEGVYISINGGPICALRASDGTPRWCRKAGDEVLAVLNNVVYTQGLLASPSDTSLALYTFDALRASDGKPLWRTQIRGGVFDRPSVGLANADEMVYLATFDGAVQARQANNGVQNWQRKVGDGFFGFLVV